MNHPSSEQELFYQLCLRMGAVHARQRLGIETENEALIFGQGRNFFHIENWHSIHGVIKACLQVAGLLRRGQRNSRKIQLNYNRFVLPRLPAAFEGFRILHLSDLHVDMDEAALQALIEKVREVDYDLCVLTGDYRKRTYGSIDACMEGMGRLRAVLKEPVFAVLGNHDSIRMVPQLESQGYQLLLNEHQAIDRNGERIFLLGVDDAHYYRMDNLEKTMAGVPDTAIKILLCHTPEVFRQAGHAGIDVFLCGHTHGGQICLPGGIPVTLDADCPRHVGKGFWSYQRMQGYTSVGAGTSVVNVRLNCLPEITLHQLSSQAR